MSKQTTNVDYCQCVYCNHKWNGEKACNGDINTSIIICPECGKEMGVFLSIEYMCVELD